MKIVVTGSLGHISKPLVEGLLVKNQTVTVISSNSERRMAIEELGAHAAVGQLDDEEFLAATFQEADAVYCMIPPNFSEPDQVAYYHRLGQSYRKAIVASRIKRVVHLSSWGAHREKGTGIILGSHAVETELNEIDGLRLTHLRAGSIYYNLYGFLGMIRHKNMIGSNYGEEDKIVWVSPLDIAEAAVEELLSQSHTTQHIRYVASDERTARETAKILGQSLGKPDLPWVLFSREQTKEGMLQNGVPAAIVEDILDLNESIHNGNLGEDYEKLKPVPLGKVKLEDFAKEFEKVYHGR